MIDLKNHISNYLTNKGHILNSNDMGIVIDIISTVSVITPNEINMEDDNNTFECQNIKYHKHITMKIYDYLKYVDESIRFPLTLDIQDAIRSYKLSYLDYLNNKSNLMQIRNHDDQIHHGQSKRRRCS